MGDDASPGSEYLLLGCTFEPRALLGREFIHSCKVYAGLRYNYTMRGSIRRYISNAQMPPLEIRTHAPWSQQRSACSITRDCVAYASLRFQMCALIYVRLQGPPTGGGGAVGFNMQDDTCMGVSRAGVACTQIHAHGSTPASVRYTSIH